MQRIRNRIAAALTAAVTAFCCLCLRVQADTEPPEAAASVLMEAQTGTVLAGEQADAPRPVGSMTKLMTVLLIARAVEEGRLTPDTTVCIAPSAEGVPGATVWLRSGEQMTVTALLKAVIIGNANDAAVALACRAAGSEAGFTGQMNAAAAGLGMTRTRYADCTGLSAENVSTAADTALLCRALLDFPWLTPVFTTWRDELRGGATELVTENRLVRDEDGILGFKAGRGADCGYTLAAAARRDGMTCIAVVLGCPDPDARFRTGRQLLRQGFREFYVTTPDFAAEFLRPVTVRGGISAAVTAAAEGLRAVAVPKNENVSCFVILPKYVEAPVAAGQTIGALAFYCGDSLLYETPLTAAEAVPRRGFRESLGILLGSMFK